MRATEIAVDCGGRDDLAQSASSKRRNPDRTEPTIGAARHAYDTTVRLPERPQLSKAQKQKLNRRREKPGDTLEKLGEVV